MPRVYVAFILDMKIVFNKIINNSRLPAWYFSLTWMGNKEFTIVGLKSTLEKKCHSVRDSINSLLSSLEWPTLQLCRENVRTLQNNQIFITNTN